MNDFTHSMYDKLPILRFEGAKILLIYLFVIFLKIVENFLENEKHYEYCYQSISGPMKDAL